MYYRICFDVDQYATFVPDNYTYDFIQLFDGRSLIKDWDRVHLHTIDSRDRRPMPDLIDGICPICSENAMNLLCAICDNCVEFLPCTVGKKKVQYYFMNIIRVEDCIDYEKSDFVRLYPNKQILYFDHIVFTREILSPIFRIPDQKGSFFFVNDKFVSAYNKLNLTGMYFENKLFV